MGAGKEKNKSNKTPIAVLRTFSLICGFDWKTRVAAISGAV